MEDQNPPLFSTFKSLFDHQLPDQHRTVTKATDKCDLPLIDLNLLDNTSKDCCKREIVRASTEWGFFQVVNHGMPKELLERMRSTMVNIFQQPFEKKEKERLMDFAADSYRWGGPTVTSLKELSWSETYHIPLSQTNLHEMSEPAWQTIEEFATIMSHLAHQLSSILAEGLGYNSTYIQDNCTCHTCYLRLNHYPPCPILDEVYGLIPHTDSDFMTILFQDQVGGLQLLKDGRWITVKPNPNALVINIGDLFQAWSNGVYKSVEHRVMANPKLERFSIAYFLCPSYDTMIQSPKEPSIYRKFTFKEYRQQVQEDVKQTGHKIGLPRFLKT